MADSRGRHLSPSTTYKVDLWVKSGCRIAEARDYFWDRVREGLPEKSVFIFMVGLCDITTKIGSGEYREDIQAKHHNDIFNIKTDMSALSAEVIKQGCRAVWCTIPPMHFQHFNGVQYQQKRTTHLKRKMWYPLMQSMHLELVADINKFIITLNAVHSLQTVYLHRNVVKQKKNGKIKYHFHLLQDGVHPRRSEIDVWNRQMGGVFINIKSLL